MAGSVSKGAPAQSATQSNGASSSGRPAEPANVQTYQQSAAAPQSVSVSGASSSLPPEPASVQSFRQRLPGTPVPPPAIKMPIMLGDSPSSKPQQAQQQPAAAHSGADAASGGWGAGAATPGGASLASESYISSSAYSGGRPSLGASPGSAQVQEQEHMSNGSEATAAAVSGPAAAAEGTAGADAVGAPAAAAPADTTAASAAIAAAFAMPNPAAAGTEAAAASAALVAAFAAPNQADASTAAAGAAPGPAASNTTFASCMYATPAAAFNSPGGSYSDYTEGSNAQYYTGLQGSSNSSRVVSTTAATTRQRAAQATADSADSGAVGTNVAGWSGPDVGDQGTTAAAAAAGTEPAGAFAGFRVPTEQQQVAEDAIASPVMCSVAAAPAVLTTAGHNSADKRAAAAAAGGCGVCATATAQKRMLQDLLGSPSDESDISDDSSLSPASPFELRGGSVLRHGALHTGVGVHKEVVAEREECASPAPGATDGANVGQLQQQQEQLVANSPTLSELGFVAASASADVAAAKRLQQQQKQQEEQEAVCSGGKDRGAADLAGLSFEQRLELLCSDDSSAGSDAGQRSAASTPGSQTRGAQGDFVQGSISIMSSQDVCINTGVAGTAGGAAADEYAGEEDAGDVESAGVQGAGVACCATQTSPYSLAYGGLGDQVHAVCLFAGSCACPRMLAGSHSSQHASAHCTMATNQL